MKNENTKTENFREDFIAAQFELDSLDKPLAGYTFKNDYWNGWGCPYFTFEAMQQLVTAVSDDEYITAFYSKHNDEFIFFDHLNGHDDGQNYVNQIGATIINGIKVYKAHELCWCFHRVRDEAATVEPDALKSFDVQILYKEWLTVTVYANSENEARKLAERGDAIPDAYWEKLGKLQSDFSLDFCDNDTDVIRIIENE